MAIHFSIFYDIVVFKLKSWFFRTHIASLCLPLWTLYNHWLLWKLVGEIVCKEGDKSQTLLAFSNINLHFFTLAKRQYSLRKCNASLTCRRFGLKVKAVSEVSNGAAFKLKANGLHFWFVSCFLKFPYSSERSRLVFVEKANTSVQTSLQQCASNWSNHQEVLGEYVFLPAGCHGVTDCRPLWLGLQRSCSQALPPNSSNDT